MKRFYLYIILTRPNTIVSKLIHLIKKMNIPMRPFLSIKIFITCIVLVGNMFLYLLLAGLSVKISMKEYINYIITCRV